MEIVDELMTPGCPQCAIKHLSAALYHRAKTGAANTLPPLQAAVCECTAAINLVEVLNGYKSHLWYAVGALERAEECAIMTFGTARTAREARLILENRGLEGVKDALHHLVVGSIQSPAEWAAAHFDEARRELPAMADQMRMDDLVGSIERVRKEYFNLPPVTVSGGEQTQTGKEPDMATKKTPAKKAACKGTKCACKGGKTKKGK